MSRHWPWEVSLWMENQHVCGGALIDPSWVVTVAHCIQGTEEYSVVLGTSKLQPMNFTRALQVPVRDIIMHPKNRGQTFIVGDVALVHLQTPVTFSEYVQPICLPEPNFNLKVGTQCWVTGWSQVKQPNSTLTPELQEAEVFIMDSKRWDMICATNYGENLCSGDSGGPLACEVEGGWILAGVLSWEKACAKAQNPGVYTRVTKYTKWIKKQMSNGAFSGPCASACLRFLCWLLQPGMGS
uniref:Peptidase S1 domain-containing protein n=1 Tax=Aotus nancymaae TaxID=37293 RepID=A0A2K5EC22_AOTNA